MALKITIHEKCSRCGQRAARKVGDRIIDLAHRCSERAPGPPIPPRNFRATEVIFETGEFDQSILRDELDQAWSLIDDLRDKRWRAEERAILALKEAWRSVYIS